jgi:hypothetical protein
MKIANQIQAINFALDSFCFGPDRSIPENPLFSILSKSSLSLIVEASVRKFEGVLFSLKPANCQPIG